MFVSTTRGKTRCHRRHRRRHSSLGANGFTVSMNDWHVVACAICFIQNTRNKSVLFSYDAKCKEETHNRRWAVPNTFSTFNNNKSFSIYETYIYIINLRGASCDWGRNYFFLVSMGFRQQSVYVAITLTFIFYFFFVFRCVIICVLVETFGWRLLKWNSSCYYLSTHTKMGGTAWSCVHDVR